MTGETLKERTARLGQLLGEWSNEEGTVTAWGNYIQKEVATWLNIMRNSSGEGSQMCIMRSLP